MSKRFSESGPEVVGYHDAPEVVTPNEDDGKYPYDAKFARRSEEGKYLAPTDEGKHLSPQGSGEVQGPKETYTMSNLEHDQRAAPSDEEPVKPKPRRICGMKRGVFIAVCVVAIVVILAVVLGAGLGATLGSNGSNSSTPTVLDRTGIAVMQPNGSGTTYQYYQDADGRIIENRYTNGVWSIQNEATVESAVVATDAVDGSPIAATSWVQNGNLYRSVFFIDSNFKVRTTNTTGLNDWSPSLNILTYEGGDSVVAGTVALAASADSDPNGLNGVRFYYASHQGWIQEGGIDFEGVYSDQWYLWHPFITINNSTRIITSYTDNNSGVATALFNSTLHVYARNTTTGTLQRSEWNYAEALVYNRTDWQFGADGPSVPSGTDFAAAVTEAGTDSVFYQSGDNTIWQAQWQDSQTETSSSVVGQSSQDKLSAVYNSSASAAVVYYQPQGGNGSIAYQGVQADGSLTLSGVIN